MNKELKSFIEGIVDDASLPYRCSDTNHKNFFSYYGEIRFREFCDLGFTIATHHARTTGHIIFIQYTWSEILADIRSGEKKIAPVTVFEINPNKVPSVGKLIGKVGKVNFLDLAEEEYIVFSNRLTICRNQLRKKD